MRADRRDLLSLFGGGLGMLSGCTGDRIADPSSQTPGTTTEQPLAQHGFPPTICQEEVMDEPGIPAIIEPSFDRDWRDITVDDRYRLDPTVGGLISEQTVIGLVRGERARAYPLEILYYHEIINDRFGDSKSEPDRPILISFCPLCKSGVVADRTIDGEATDFVVSGLLWRPPRIQASASIEANRTVGATRRNGSDSVRHSGNLVMYDTATGSYWSQILARAICGPRRGQTLPIVPSTVTTWADWQRSHPHTEVLLPPPYSKSVR
ncbi:MAG: DUF3179 domain-containing (seleno)protein [Halobacteriales archaeon]